MRPQATTTKQALQICTNLISLGQWNLPINVIIIHFNQSIWHIVLKCSLFPCDFPVDMILILYNNFNPNFRYKFYKNPSSIKKKKKKDKLNCRNWNIRINWVYPITTCGGTVHTCVCVNRWITVTVPSFIILHL